MVPDTDRWSGFHGAKITTLSFSPDGTKLASGSLDNHIIVWSLEKPSERVKVEF